MKKRERGPMDGAFERGHVPMDAPPGIEEREYAAWKAAGGQVLPAYRLPPGHMIMTPSAFPCWKCGIMLTHLEPPVDGWHYHCRGCQHLTKPAHELQSALAETPDGAVGIVAAVACRIEPVPKGTAS